MRTLGRVDETNPVEWGSALNRGLVSWWLPLANRMGTGTLFDIAGSNRGTLTNGPTWAAGPNGFPGMVFSGTVSGGAKCSAANRIPQFATEDGTIVVTAMTTTFTGKDVAFYVGASADSSPALSLQMRSNGIYIEGYGNGVTPNLLGATSLAVNTVYHMVFTTANAGTNTVYLNGKSDANNTSTPQSGTYASVTVGSFNNNYDGFNGTILDAALYSRALSASEVYALYDQSLRGYPDLLRRYSNASWFVGTALTAYTLSATAGAYTYTGSDPSAYFNRQAGVGAGAYVLTGIDPGTYFGRRLDSSGAYTYTPSDPSTYFGRQVAGAGTYAVTTSNPDLNRTYQLDATGAYAATPSAPDLNRAYRLDATGTYAVTPSNPDTIRGWLADVIPGTYAHSGTGVNVWFNRAASAAGSYAYSGSNPSLAYSAGGLVDDQYIYNTVVR